VPAQISCVDLSCSRDNRLLFDGLTLQVRAGELCVLLGPNGAGKSTLLRCLAGLYPDFEGTVQVDACHYFGHRLALNPLLDAAENLQWYAALAGVDSDAEATLDRVGLTGYGPVPVAQMSAGQQRRVALARLLTVPARVWLLDEPYTALDGAGQALVDELISEHLAANGSALCATHQLLGITPNAELQLGTA